MLYLLRFHPRHPMVRREKLRQRLVRSIYEAEKRSGLAWNVIAALAYRESAFKLSARGKIGERGIMQIHGSLPWKHCRKMEKRWVNRNSMNDQLICGAHWFNYGKDVVCDGSIAQGHAKYLTKATCVPKTRSLKAKVKRRLETAAEIISEEVQGKF